MTMGPAPMMRMLWRSVLFMRHASTRLRQPSRSHRGLLPARLLLGEAQLRLQPPQHQMIEALEERLQIVRARARLRMALETERRPILEGETLERAVEERAVRGPHVGRQRRLVDREAVILAGDEHPPGIEVLHRMVGAMVAELHLQRAPAAGEAEDLMAEADAEHRNVGVEKLAGRVDGVVAGLGVAG